jgi:hypothetical protein
MGGACADSGSQFSDASSRMSKCHRVRYSTASPYDSLAAHAIALPSASADDQSPVCTPLLPSRYRSIDPTPNAPRNASTPHVERSTPPHRPKPNASSPTARAHARSACTPLAPSRSNARRPDATQRVASGTIRSASGSREHGAEARRTLIRVAGLLPHVRRDRLSRKRACQAKVEGCNPL